MHQWLAFPWLRYTLWLLAGIIAAFAEPGLAAEVLCLGMGAAVCYLLAVWLLRSNNSRPQMLWGVLAFFTLFSLGYLSASKLVKVPELLTAGQEHWWIEVQEAPVAGPKNLRFKASTSAAAGGEALVQALVYLPLSSLKTQELPAVGEVWFVKGRLQQVPAPLNPHEFDYRAFLAAQGLHYQLFTHKALRVQAPQGILIRWKRFGYASKTYLLKLIQSFVTDHQAAALVKAMVLGQRSGLDPSLRQAYANAGVMHVLAVSGLHVGMIFGIFLLLYRYFQRSRTQRMCWLFVVIVVLWTYAWLTGLAPSAMRATLMFSIIALGKSQRRAANIYNSIGLSAFILLALNPLLIRQVGFQLSYLAVLGIVYLQPRISGWYQPKSSWKNRLWQLFTVSLAAQIATFPLGLFYFKQFPTYFFIGNLLAVPLAFFILYATLLLFVFHGLPLLNEWTGWLVNALARLMNFWVQLTEALPHSKLVATISSWEAGLIYIILMSILILLRCRQYAWVKVSFCFLLLLLVSGLLNSYQWYSQRKLTVYHIPGHSLLQLVQGRQEVLMYLGQMPSIRQLEYHVMPARLHAGLAVLQADQSGALSAAGTNELQMNSLKQDFQVAQRVHRGIIYMVWQGKRVALIDGSKAFHLPASRVEVDALLLHRNPEVSVKQLEQAFKFKIMVLDGSNSWRYQQLRESEAKSLHLPLHRTALAGAYQLEL